MAWYSPFLKGLRLVYNLYGAGVPQEASQSLGHEFDVSIASGILHHEFRHEQTASGYLGHNFNLSGVITSSGLNHEFDVNQITSAQTLGHQANVNEITKERVLGHSLGVEQTATGLLGHQANVPGITTSSGLNHEVNVNEVTTASNLGQQFNANEIVTDRGLGHLVGVSATASGFLGHQNNVNGIITSSGLAHEFNANEITTSVVLGHQANVNEVTKDNALGHQAAVTNTASGLLGHQGNVSGIVTASSLNHEFNVNSITVNSRLGQQLTVNEITKDTVLGHQAGVEKTDSSILGHQFQGAVTTAEELGHQTNVSTVTTSTGLGQEYNVNEISKNQVLGHKFGFELTDDKVLGHVFGYSVTSENALGQQYSVPNIATASGLGHHLDVTPVTRSNRLGHEVGVNFETNTSLKHQWSVAYTVSGLLGHEINISPVVMSSKLGHEFFQNSTKHALGQQFSALGVASDTSRVGHTATVDFVKPPGHLGHQFTLVFSLSLPDPTTYTANVVYTGSESSDIAWPEFSGVVGSARHSSDPAYNPVLSTTTWNGFSTTPSGLIEDDLILGSFAFGGEPGNVRSASYTHLEDPAYLPEEFGDTDFQGMQWVSPVVTSGIAGWNNLVDVAARLTSFHAETDFFGFPVFFGRQLTISGLFRELVGLPSGTEVGNQIDGDDPFTLALPTNALVSEPTFAFTGYTHAGTARPVLERQLELQTIFVDYPTGRALKRNDSQVRVGFTNYIVSEQPETLSWRLGVNTSPGVFTQTITTDQWVASGLSRNFTVPALANSNVIRGRVEASLDLVGSIFNGIIPPEIPEQASEDGVLFFTGGTLLWPDIEAVSSVLNHTVVITQSGFRRLPTGLIIKEEGLGSQGKAVKINTTGSNLISATFKKLPVITTAQVVDEMQLLPITGSTFTVTISSANISSASVGAYKPAGNNTLGKIVLFDEEGE